MHLYLQCKVVCTIKAYATYIQFVHIWPLVFGIYEHNLFLWLQIITHITTKSDGCNDCGAVGERSTLLAYEAHFVISVVDLSFHKIQISERKCLVINASGNWKWYEQWCSDACLAIKWVIPLTSVRVNTFDLISIQKTSFSVTTDALRNSRSL